MRALPPKKNNQKVVNPVDLGPSGSFRVGTAYSSGGYVHVLLDTLPSRIKLWGTVTVCANNRRLGRAICLGLISPKNLAAEPPPARALPRRDLRWYKVQLRRDQIPHVCVAPLVWRRIWFSKVLEFGFGLPELLRHVEKSQLCSSHG